MEKYLSQQQVKTILDSAPKGADQDKLIQGMVDRGYTLQGLNDQPKQPVNKNTSQPDQSGIVGKAKSFSGGVAEGLGAQLPLQAIDYLGRKVVNSVGTDQMKQNITNAKPLTEQFNDVTNQTENPISAGAGNVAGTVAGVSNIAVPLVKSIPFIANRIAETTVKKGVGAVGQIAQGASDAVKPFQEALSAINTKGIKTYSDLGTRISDAIPTYAKVVDDALSKDSTMKPLSSFVSKFKTSTGSDVSTNYVKNAMTDLKELYDKTGDIVKAKEIDDLLSLGDNLQLTNKTVNDISRQYGQEFGTKAFSKVTGEALTSVNAQKFETTRSGLKSVARTGLGGEEAKNADKVMSSLYDAQKLVDKNIEAVNKLKQKIQERGWVSKGVYGIIKTADTLTGGAIRGATDAVLSRGSGLKTLNALDLEKNLSKNLKLIEKAMKESTEAKFLQSLKMISK